MREPFFTTNNNNTRENKVPSPPNDRRSKRKMDQRRLGIRGLFKNPPQPHMCVQDTLLGSSEPCFINVLSWDKISMPAHPTDPIPLYGGIRIINNSMNSLTFTNSYEGCKPGKQPVIFAVLANTEILKFSGKTAKDPNERDALIYLILDFIEVMNEGIHFSHQFSVVPNRDVVGELKDIWFIIQSKREQERMELTYHGEGDHGSGGADRQKTHKRDTPTVGTLEGFFAKEPWFCSAGDHEKEKITRSHSYPDGNENKSKHSVWLFSGADSNRDDGRSGATLKSPAANQDVAGCSMSRKIICVDSAPTCQGEEEEIVLFEHDYIKKTPLQRPTNSLFDYFTGTLKATSVKDSNNSTVTKDLHSKSPTATAVLPSYSEIQIKTDLPETNSKDSANGLQKVPKHKENTSLPSFTNISRGLMSRGLTSLYDKEEAELSLVVNSTGMLDAIPGTSQATFDSFDNESEEDLFDEVRRVVATKILPILPSLDSLDTESEGASLVAKRGIASEGIGPETFISTHMFPTCTEVTKKTEQHTSNNVSIHDNAEKVSCLQMPDTLDEHMKTETCNKVLPTANDWVVRSMQVNNLEQSACPLEVASRHSVGTDVQTHVAFLKDSAGMNVFGQIDVNIMQSIEENCLGNAKVLPSFHLSESTVHGCLLNRVNQCDTDALSIVPPTLLSPALEYFGKHNEVDSNENLKPLDNSNSLQVMKPIKLLDPPPSGELQGCVDTSRSLVNKIGNVEMIGVLNKTEVDPENNVTHKNYDIPCIATLGISNTVKSNKCAERKSAGGCDAVEQ